MRILNSQHDRNRPETVTVSSSSGSSDYESLSRIGSNSPWFSSSEPVEPEDGSGNGTTGGGEEETKATISFNPDGWTTISDVVDDEEVSEKRAKVIVKNWTGILPTVPRDDIFVHNEAQVADRTLAISSKILYVVLFLLVWCYILGTVQAKPTWMVYRENTQRLVPTTLGRQLSEALRPTVEDGTQVLWCDELLDHRASLTHYEFGKAGIECLLNTLEELFGPPPGMRSAGFFANLKIASDGGDWDWYSTFYWWEVKEWLGYERNEVLELAIPRSEANWSGGTWIISAAYSHRVESWITNNPAATDRWRYVVIRYRAQLYREHLALMLLFEGSLSCLVFWSSYYAVLWAVNNVALPFTRRWYYYSLFKRRNRDVSDAAQLTITVQRPLTTRGPIAWYQAIGPLQTHHPVSIQTPNDGILVPPEVKQFKGNTMCCDISGMVGLIQRAAMEVAAGPAVRDYVPITPALAAALLQQIIYHFDSLAMFYGYPSVNNPITVQATQFVRDIINNILPVHMHTSWESMCFCRWMLRDQAVHNALVAKGCDPTAVRCLSLEALERHTLGLIIASFGRCKSAAEKDRRASAYSKMSWMGNYLLNTRSMQNAVSSQVMIASSPFMINLLVAPTDQDVRGTSSHLTRSLDSRINESIVFTDRE